MYENKDQDLRFYVGGPSGAIMNKSTKKEQSISQEYRLLLGSHLSPHRVPDIVVRNLVFPPCCGK